MKKDIRSFSKAYDNTSTITEGTTFNELATDMPSKNDTVPVDSTDTHRQHTVLDKETTEELTNTFIQDNTDDSTIDDKDIDTIDVFYKYITDKGITDNDIKLIQQRIIQGESINFTTTILQRKKLILTTRPAWVNEVIIEELNKYPNVSYQMYVDIVSKVNLAASLVVFDDFKFEKLTRDNYEDRVNMLRDLPTFIYDKMVAELVLFDRLIAVATSDKYLETFI